MVPCCFSVDFEDYAHDLQRMLGVSKPRKTPDSLWKGYELIDRFSTEHLGGAKVTFFTTGQVARNYPDVVRQIAKDGHEVACHYNEHDNIAEQTPEDFRENLAVAVELLSKASGAAVKGFRAPDFSIDESCEDWAYEILSDFFVYDSSYVTKRPLRQLDGLQAFAWPSGNRLYEFPIYKRQIFPGVAIRVIGGTYLRFLPANVIVKYLSEAWREGFIPQLYLHPYDLLHEYEQWSRWRDLEELTPASRAYWWVRQHQWHSIGNRSALDKLRRIYDSFMHPGPLADLVESTVADQKPVRSQGDPQQAK